MEVYGRLKAAFREYRKLKADHQPTAPVEQAIIFYAGWLGHYVADGAQPLHTTIKYNGWWGRIRTGIRRCMTSMLSSRQLCWSEHRGKEFF